MPVLFSVVLNRMVYFLVPSFLTSETAMSDIITLNVGGTIYTTSRTTLTLYPTLMLECMFSDRLPSAVDKNGHYVIFRYVLNFLRSSKLTLPENFQEYDLLAVEADFYQIPELIKVVSERFCERTREKRVISL